MSDPVRLLDNLNSTPAERELVDAWRSMTAPGGARARALALGSAAGVAMGSVAAAAVKGSMTGSIATAGGAGAGVSTTATSAGAGGVAATAAGGSSVVTVSSVSSVVAVKWIAALGFVAVASGASAVVVQRTQAPPRSATVVAAATAVSTPPSRLSAVGEATAVGAADGPQSHEATSPPTPVSVSALPSVASVPVSELPSASPVERAPRRPLADSSLAPQLAAIDLAHGALAAGDAARALRELDAFDAQYPGGALAEEAAALRFDALVASGDKGGANRAARAFVTRWPASPYTARLRRSLASTE